MNSGDATTAIVGNELTTICIVAVLAHEPAAGVNVYVVVVVLSNAGDQVPSIPLFDVVGKADEEAPEHTAATCVNAGVTLGFTTICMVVALAHTPAVGVNVYVVVVVLIIAGDQVPSIPLFDVVGNADNEAPEHIAATCVNVGVTLGFTTISIVDVLAHEPAAGVNV